MYFNDLNDAPIKNIKKKDAFWGTDEVTNYHKKVKDDKFHNNKWN